MVQCYGFVNRCQRISGTYFAVISRVISLIKIRILIVMANPVTPEKKGKRPTTFKDTYKKDFPCIRESRKGPTHAFCTECRSDFRLVAGGSNDIRNHIQTTKHQTNVKHANASNKSLTLDRFFRPDNFDVINAEVTFTDFLVEHNMQCQQDLVTMLVHVFERCFQTPK